MEGPKLCKQHMTYIDTKYSCEKMVCIYCSKLCTNCDPFKYYCQEHTDCPTCSENNKESDDKKCADHQYLSEHTCCLCSARICHAHEKCLQCGGSWCATCYAMIEYMARGKICPYCKNIGVNTSRDDALYRITIKH